MYKKMSNIVSITEFRNNIAEVVNRVRYRNETIYLVRGKTLVAKVIRVDDYLPETTKNRKGRPAFALRASAGEAGFVPAAWMIFGKGFRELREFGRAFGRRFMKTASLGFKQGSIKFRRWVKFCFSFQKSWG